LTYVELKLHSPVQSDLPVLADLASRKSASAPPILRITCSKENIENIPFGDRFSWFFFGSFEVRKDEPDIVRKMA